MSRTVLIPTESGSAGGYLVRMNATGATTTVGQPVCEDMTTAGDGYRGVDPATANLKSPVGVWAEAVANGDPGKVWSFGSGRKQVYVDGTTDVAVGDNLVVTSAGLYLVKGASDGSDMPIATCHEAYTTAGLALKYVVFKQ